MAPDPNSRRPGHHRPHWLRPTLQGAAALACLAAACGVARALDPMVDLANLAMVFVLACTLVAFWLPVWASALFTLTGVTLFNWMFVPPRGSLSVDGHQNLWLLGAMMAVSLAIGALMGKLRYQATLARQHAHDARQLQTLGEALRAATDPQAMALALYETLQPYATQGTALMILREELPDTDRPEAAAWWGEPDEAEAIGLWLCLRDGRSFGAGSDRYSELSAWYLPVRGPQPDGARPAGASGAGSPAAPFTWGAVLLRVGQPDPPQEEREHVQALCDLLGGALHRHHLTRRVDNAQRAAEAQSLRSALLTAIAHDFRTPLASILGAASSLESQSDRLPEAQRRRLLAQIQQETLALSSMTANTLQLVRLEGDQVDLHQDWESLEELVGAVMSRTRQRDPTRRVRARVEPGLPLLRVDAQLLTQLLENLVDNALKYSDDAVDVVARRVGDEVMLAVQDRGPGVPAAERGQIFQMFQRGTSASGTRQRGTGLGLAVCRAIALVHHGRLGVRPRQHGGSSFELYLPLPEAPPALPGPPLTLRGPDDPYPAGRG